MQTLQEAMQSQLKIAHPIKQTTLASYSRKQLETYMIDCHGFDVDQCAEWQTKADIACDIRSFGWEVECLAYLT